MVGKMSSHLSLISFVIFMCLLILESTSSPLAVPSTNRHNRHQDKYSLRNIPPLSHECRKQYPPFLWVIKRPNSNKPSYLFGTIHVAYTRVWDSMPVFKLMRYLEESDRVYFELDFQDKNFAGKLEDCKKLPPEVNLKNTLSPDLYSKITQNIKKTKQWLHNLASEASRASGDLSPSESFSAMIKGWDRQRLIWTVLMFDSLNENSFKIESSVTLDRYLAIEAQRLGKQIGAVEEFEDQCQPLNSLNETLVIFALNFTLKRNDRIREGISTMTQGTDSLVHDYNCGDLEALFSSDTQPPALIKHDPDIKLSLQEMEMAKQMDHYFKQKFITERNHKMTRKIRTLLEANPNKVYFFAVGAGHFGGDDSIIDLLTSDGYEISRDKEMSQSEFEGKRSQNVNDGSQPRIADANSITIGRISLFQRDEKLASVSSLDLGEVPLVERESIKHRPIQSVPMGKDYEHFWFERGFYQMAREFFTRTQKFAVFHPSVFSFDHFGSPSTDFLGNELTWYENLDLMQGPC